MQDIENYIVDVLLTKIPLRPGAKKGLLFLQANINFG